MSNYIVSDTNLTAVANAIRTRGETQAPLSFPDGFAAAIRAIPSGGAVTEKDVNFYDYDGELVYSYTAAAFAALESLPENPTHSGLTAQGWNWTLSDAKTYVAKFGHLDIGQNYVTTDGKTHLHIHIDDDDEIYLEWNQSTANGVSIDPGDGSAACTDAGTGNRSLTLHYQPGDYDLTLECVSGTYSLGGANGTIFGTYSTMNTYRTKKLRKVFVGSGITSFQNNLFNNCINLSEISIPKQVLSFGGYVFSQTKIKGVVIPSGCTAIGWNFFEDCAVLEHICFPKEITSYAQNYTFNKTYSLRNVCLPSNFAQITNNGFSACSALYRVTGEPTEIVASAFNACLCLREIDLSKVTAVGDQAFSNCRNLRSLDLSSATSLGSLSFNFCIGLENVTLGNSLTSIGANCFQNCYGLSQITIPASVTNIAANAFKNASGLYRIHMLGTTPPTLSATSAFNNTPADMKIIVPYSADHSVLETYKTTTNWSNFASKMEEAAQ